MPAFNAIQETEIALPNYLTEAEWDALPQEFKTKRPFAPSGQTPTVDDMMPRRPPWLRRNDGISRRRLFERFAGLVTYGSPLDKFAALWPRVVPLNRQAAVFPKTCEWVNIHDPTDPVSAKLNAFREPTNSEGAEPDRIALQPQNFAGRASLVFGLSHIRYFQPRAGKTKSMPAALTEALLEGKDARLSKAAAGAAMSATASWLRLAAALVQVALLTFALAVAAGLLLLLIGKALPKAAAATVKQAIGELCPRLLAILHEGGLPAGEAAVAIVLVAAFLIIVAAGLLRLATERSGRHH